MPFKTVKSVEDKNKLIKEFLKNREALKQKLLEKKLGEQEIYRPVTKSVEKAQKTTDEKQDKMIEQLKENQENITDTIDTLSEAVSKSGSIRRGLESWVEGLPSQIDPIEEDEIEEDEEGAVGGKDVKPKVKPKKGAVFTAWDIRRLQKLGFDPTFTTLATNYKIDKKITALNQTIGGMTSKGKKSILGNQKASLLKYKKVVGDIRKAKAAEEEKSKEDEVDIMGWKPPFHEEDTIEFVPDEDVLGTPKSSKKGKGLQLSSQARSQEKILTEAVQK